MVQIDSKNETRVLMANYIDQGATNKGKMRDHKNFKSLLDLLDIPHWASH